MSYAVSRDAVSAVLDDGAVVLNMRTRRYFSLNETGTVIWRLLETGATIPDVVAALVASYEVDEASAEAELLRLLDELASAQLVTLEER